jgi:hypothetical protein
MQPSTVSDAGWHTPAPARSCRFRFHSSSSRWQRLKLQCMSAALHHQHHVNMYQCMLHALVCTQVDREAVARAGSPHASLLMPSLAVAPGRLQSAAVQAVLDNLVAAGGEEMQLQHLGPWWTSNHLVLPPPLRPSSSPCSQLTMALASSQPQAPPPPPAHCADLPGPLPCSLRLSTASLTCIFPLLPTPPHPTPPPHPPSSQAMRSGWMPASHAPSSCGGRWVCWAPAGVLCNEVQGVGRKVVQQQLGPRSAGCLSTSLWQHTPAAHVLKLQRCVRW